MFSVAYKEQPRGLNCAKGSSYTFCFDYKTEIWELIFKSLFPRVLYVRVLYKPFHCIWKLEAVSNEPLQQTFTKYFDILITFLISNLSVKSFVVLGTT